MRRHGCRPWFPVVPALLAVAPVLTACGSAVTPTSASTSLAVGDCISVTDLGEDDASPVRLVPCGPSGTVIGTGDFYAVYRVVFATTLAVPVMSRAGADDLARIFCRGPEVKPGSSLYVFPTEASFAGGFSQFLCLSH